MGKKKKILIISSIIVFVMIILVIISKKIKLEEKPANKLNSKSKLNIEMKNFSVDTTKIEVGETKDVIFSVNITSNKDMDNIKVPLIYEDKEIVGYLNDKGENGDKIPNDGIYSIQVKLTANKLKELKYNIKVKSFKTEPIKIVYYKRENKNTQRKIENIKKQIDTFVNESDFVNSSNQVSLLEKFLYTIQDVLYYKRVNNELDIYLEDGKFEYIIENLKQIDENSLSFIDREEKDIEIYKFNIKNQDIKINENQKVIFEAEIFSQIDMKNILIPIVDEYGNVIGYLNDKGENGDLQREDGIFTLEKNMSSNVFENFRCFVKVKQFSSRESNILFYDLNLEKMNEDREKFENIGKEITNIVKCTPKRKKDKIIDILDNNEFVLYYDYGESIAMYFSTGLPMIYPGWELRKDLQCD